MKSSRMNPAEARPRPLVTRCSAAPLRSCAIIACLGFAAVASIQPRAAVAVPAKAEPRTLDEITIEGEIAMPQVLFITAREPYRFADTAHRAYLPQAGAVRAQAVLPLSYWMGRALSLSIVIPAPKDGLLFPPEGQPAPSQLIESRGRN